MGREGKEGLGNASLATHQELRLPAWSPNRAGGGRPLLHRGQAGAGRLRFRRAHRPLLCPQGGAGRQERTAAGAGGAVGGERRAHQRLQGSGRDGHVPLQEGVRPKGTFQYLSVRSNRQLLQSRRDDLESLAYVAGALLKGRLPWAFSSRRRPTHPEPACIKESRTRTVFSNCPRVFVDFCNTCAAWSTEHDYATWRRAFPRLESLSDPDGRLLQKCRQDVYRSLRRNKHNSNHSDHTRGP
ncbi:hypothetical protein O3P69_015391 [Scylla paramamosain]|uniref:Uncharacterized protein n=1 Tax=Scylla paramamosain TaxID=85552 RepID=A0AAW0T5D5_SCYPA